MADPEMLPPTAGPTHSRKGTERRSREPGLQRPRLRAKAPEEAGLVHDIVLFHHSAPVSLKLLDPSLLGLRGLYVPLLQVPEHPDRHQRDCPPRASVPCPAPPPNRPHFPEAIQGRKEGHSPSCTRKPTWGTEEPAGSRAVPALTSGLAAAACL